MQVRCWKPNRSPPPVTLYDFALDFVEASEHAVCVADLTAAQCDPNRTGGYAFVLEQHGLFDEHFEAAVGAERLEQGHVTLALSAKSKVGSDDDGFRALREQPIDEVFGRKGRELPGESLDYYGVRTRSAQELGSARLKGEFFGGTGGIDERGGMGLEGEGAGSVAVRVRNAAGGAQERPMSEVYAVVIARRDHPRPVNVLSLLRCALHPEWRRLSR
jgi:hypothetical protein